MNVGAAFQEPKVTIVLQDMSPADIDALIHGLDADRNHPARAMLYKKLLEVRAFIQDINPLQRGI